MDYTNMTKEELLVEFRAIRNTLFDIQSNKDMLIRTIIDKFGTEKQKKVFTYPQDATIFEILIS